MRIASSAEGTEPQLRRSEGAPHGMSASAHPQRRLRRGPEPLFAKTHMVTAHRSPLLARSLCAPAASHRIADLASAGPAGTRRGSPHRRPQPRARRRQVGAHPRRVRVHQLQAERSQATPEAGLSPSMWARARLAHHLPGPRPPPRHGQALHQYRQLHLLPLLLASASCPGCR